MEVETWITMFLEKLSLPPEKRPLAELTIALADTFAQSHFIDRYTFIGQLLATATRRYGEYLNHSFAIHAPLDPQGYETWARQLIHATANDSVPETTDPRRRVRAEIYAVLSAHDFDSVEDLTKEIESACFNSVIHRCQSIDSVVRLWENITFIQIYSTRAAAIIANLRLGGSVPDASVRRLAAQLKSGEVTAEQLGSMAEHEMCPEASHAERQTISIRSKQTVKKRENTMYRCPKCRKPATSVTEAQLGAADEGNTVLCECECGMRFQARF